MTDVRPRQLRVHGVGGPQARKMLGLLEETDVMTVAEPSGGSEGFPTDGATRFARPIVQPDPTELCAGGSAVHPVEVYEWGGLTTGSWRRAGWVAYLPFTLINAAGWAHAASLDPSGSEIGHLGAATHRARVGRFLQKHSIAVHRGLVHVVALLATLTYVCWISYIGLELVGNEWRDLSLRRQLSPAVRDLFRVGVPAGAIAFVLIALAAIFLPQLQRGGYEIKGVPRRRLGRTRQLATTDDVSWLENDRKMRTRRVRLHGAAAAAGVVFTLVQFLRGWDRLGLVIIVIGATQTFVIAFLALVEIGGRWVRPSSLDLDAQRVPDLSILGFRMPAGAALATIGTALAHSVLSALALLVRSLLNRWPDTPAILPPRACAIHLPAVRGHAELGASDVLAGALLLAVVLLGLQAMLAVLRRRAVAEERRRSVVVAMARNAVVLGTMVASSVGIAVAVFAVTNTRAVIAKHHHSLIDWFDSYDPTTGKGLLQAVGLKALLAIPPLLWAVLSHPHDTGAARILGNVWDVLTYWERDFHPFAVPCTADRAVPELRARIEWATAEGDQLAVVAHSQGSVLAVEVIATAELRGAVQLVTFGSPLGTLYAPTWPAHIPALAKAATMQLGKAAAHGPSSCKVWVNFWRATDPVGAGVPDILEDGGASGARNVRASDPRTPMLKEGTNAWTLPPLERPLAPTTHGGHGSYLTDPMVRVAIRGILPALPPRRTFVIWAHQGGADEGPSNTLDAMRRALTPVHDPLAGAPCPGNTGVLCGASLKAHGGATALEIDVHLDHDGNLVVIHDGSLDRTTDLRGAIRWQPTARIAKADAGHWWQPGYGDDHLYPVPGTLASEYPFRSLDPIRVPSLADVLNAFPSVPLTVEVKRLRAAAPVARLLLEANDPKRRITVTALFGARLYPVRRDLRKASASTAIDLAPGLGYLLWFRLRVALGVPPTRSPYRRIQIPYRSYLGIEMLNRSVVRAAHEAGVAVDVWTLRTDCEFAHAYDLGVDGIMTDAPSGLATWLADQPARAGLP